MKKRQLQSFIATKSSINMVRANLVQLKEEKTLLTRFPIAARERSDIDLEHLSVSVVPKSLFTCDGQLLACTDKSNIMHQVENLTVLEERYGLMSDSVNGYRVIIIDGMAVVNRVIKAKEVLTCQGIFPNLA